MNAFFSPYSLYLLGVCAGKINTLNVLYCSCCVKYGVKWLSLMSVHCCFPRLHFCLILSFVVRDSKRCWERVLSAVGTGQEWSEYPRESWNENINLHWTLFWGRGKEENGAISFSAHLLAQNLGAESRRWILAHFLSVISHQDSLSLTVNLTVPALSSYMATLLTVLER